MESSLLYFKTRQSIYKRISLYVLEPKGTRLRRVIKKRPIFRFKLKYLDSFFQALWLESIKNRSFKPYYRRWTMVCQYHFDRKKLDIVYFNQTTNLLLEIQSIYSAVSEDECPEITANNKNFEITENPEVTNKSPEVTNESPEVTNESPKETEINKKRKRNNSESWVFKEGHFKNNPQRGKMFALRCYSFLIW